MAGLIIHDLSTLEIATEFQKEFNKINNNMKTTAHGYISFCSLSDTLPLHQDNVDVFYVQAIGKINWIIKDSNNNLIETMLNPGDAVYVPQGIWHQTKVLEPRVGISYALEPI